MSINTKSRVFISAAVLLGVATTSVIAATTLDRNNLVVKADSYALDLSSSNTPSSITSTETYTSVTATPSRYVSLNYADAKKKDTYHVSLKASTGAISNAVIVNGISSLTATFAGSLTLQYGYTSIAEHSVSLTSGTAAQCPGNYFKITAGSDACDLTSLTLSYSCAVTEKVIITYNNADKTSESIAKGTTVAGLPHATKQGYSFKEWLDASGNVVDGATVLNAATTLTASYKAVSASALGTSEDVYAYTSMSNFSTNAVWINTAADGTSVIAEIGEGNARVDASSSSASGAEVINVGMPLIKYQSVWEANFTLKFNYDAAALSVGGITIVSSTKANQIYAVSVMADGTNATLYVDSVDKGTISDSDILTGSKRLGIALTRNATTMPYGQMLITKVTRGILDYKAQMATSLAAISDGDTAYSSDYLNYRNCANYLTAYEKESYTVPTKISAITSAISGVSQKVIEWVDPIKVVNDGTYSSYDTDNKYYKVQTQEKSDGALTRLDYHFVMPAFPFNLTTSGQVVIVSGYSPTISIAGTVVNNKNSSWAVWDFSTSGGVVTLTEENTRVAVTLNDKVASGEVGLAFTLTLQSSEVYNESSFRPWTMKF